MNKIKKCKVCGRECKNLNLGMCTKHYNQYKKYGYFTKDEVVKQNKYKKLKGK